MHRAIQLISDHMKQKELKFDVRELDEISVLSIGYSEENHSSKIQMYATDNDNDIKVRSEIIAKFSGEKLQKGLELINKLNEEYRFAKFVIDSDGDLTAEYDFPKNMSDEAIGECAIELSIRMSSIINDVYPEIMRTVWA